MPELIEQAAPLLADLLDHEDEQTFHQALSHLCREHYPFEEPYTDPRFQGSFAAALYHGMPLPSRRFQPTPLAKPGRNEPCPCGSGKKYKHCCAALPLPPQPPADGLFELALPHLKAKTWTKLARNDHLPRHYRQIMADTAMHDGKPKKAWQLIKPLFDRLGDLVNADADLVSTGFDALFDLGYDRLRLNAMHGLITVLAASVRAVAHQRLAMYASEAQDFDTARDQLDRARRADPDHPELPMAELCILPYVVSDDELRERASFWRARLRHQYGEDYPGASFIELIASEGRAGAETAFGRPIFSQADPEEADAAEDTEEVPSHLVYEINLIRLSNYLQVAMGASAERLDTTRKGALTLEPAGLAEALERWQRSWFAGVSERAQIKRPGTFAEHHDRAHQLNPDWLLMLGAEPGLFGCSAVLQELVDCAEVLPDGMTVNAETRLEAPLRSQIQCHLNTVLDHLEAAAARLTNKPDNRPFQLLAEDQIFDLQAQGNGIAAWLLAQRLVRVHPRAPATLQNIAHMTESEALGTALSPPDP